MIKTQNLLSITLANTLFCMFLLLSFAFLNFKLNLQLEHLFSLIILLLTGIFCGFITSKKAQNKKLVYTGITSTIFLLLYLTISFLLKKSILVNNMHLICMFNIYFGAIIGCLLSLHQKDTLKGRKKS